METYETRQVGAFTVKVVHDDDPMSPRDWDNVGKFYGTVGYTFEDVTTDSIGEAYRQAREDAGGPILALPCRFVDQSYGMLSETHDWGYANVIYWAPLSKVEEEGWTDVAQLRECLRAELHTMDQYLEGDVWGWVLEGGATHHHLDSCWGFFGTDDAMSEGIAAAEYKEGQRWERWASVPEWVRQTVLAQEEVAA